MSDYNTTESVIYKIHCLDNSCDFVYFGSTINFQNRKRTHKSTYNNINGKGYNYKLYETIRAHGGFGNWIMEIVEVFPCENKRDLHMREQWYITSAKRKINSVRAITTPEERKIVYKENKKQYSLANKTEIAEYQKKYRLANKAEIAEQKKQYQIANKDKNKDEKREKNRLYNLANRDKLRERRRLYYLANKERLLEEKNKIESI